jgi:RHS repeat-associated protein
VRLGNVVLSSTQLLTTYDGDGNRVRKSNGNLAANGTLYWYMTPGVVAETDLAGTLKSEYVFFDGERVARRDGPTGTAGVFYYFSDHLKTASVITDSAGVIKAESDYYPWGGELKFVDNDSSNDYKFTGKKRDLETGLDYFGARYYSNGLGRWVSADWSAAPVPVPYANFGDPQSLNLYGFVGGNPASKVDADGHCPSCDTPTLPTPTAEDVKLIDEAGKRALAEEEAAATGEAAGGRLLGPLAGIAMFVGEMIFPESVDSGERMGGNVSRVAAKPGQLQETQHDPEPQVSTSGDGARLRNGKKGGENVDAATGREKHAELADKVKQKAGWKSEPRLTDPKTGKTVKPDAVTKSGHPLEYKPRTPSGQAAGRSQLKKYERSTGKNGRVIYYDK